MGSESRTRGGEPTPPRDLAPGAGNKAGWDQPATRRLGLRALGRIHRYGLSFRAPRVLPLGRAPLPALSELAGVQWYLRHPYCTALLVLEGGTIRLEHYAADFAPDQLHSIQSITKTSVHLFTGRLVEAGLLDPARTVAEYLPAMSSGYAGAKIQDVLDMAVVNDYTEDYADPSSSVGLLEDAHGWRVIGGHEHVNLRTFLARITASGTSAGPRRLHYKTANTDVMAWICECAAGRALANLYLELIEAAGTESVVRLSTDRDGIPFAGGGLHMTLRDLGRYGLLLARGGLGVSGQLVGSPAFRDATRATAAAGTPSLLGRGWYRNFLETNGDWLGHNGYGGQWLMVYPDQELVIAVLSGVSDAAGHDWTFLERLAGMGEEIAGSLLD